MNELIFQLHTPEEFRYLSSLGHWVAGYIFLGITIIAFFQSRGFLISRRYLWPALTVIAGLIFIPYLLVHHSLEQIPFVWRVIRLDPQQGQHFIMFNLIFLAGIVELLLSLKKLRGLFWQFTWPGVVAVIGLMFLFHPQHGTAEAIAYTVPYHRLLGSVLIVTGLFKAGGVIWPKRYRWLTWSWILALFIASFLLIIFNEPEGSYQQDSSQYEYH